MALLYLQHAEDVRVLLLGLIRQQVQTIAPAIPLTPKQSLVRVPVLLSDNALGAHHANCFEIEASKYGCAVTRTLPYTVRATPQSPNPPPATNNTQSKRHDQPTHPPPCRFLYRI